MDRDYMEQRRASVAAARAMGLCEGDEVAVGDRAYAVTRISDDGVEGELMTESGHFVSSSSPDELDMRLPGWTRLRGRAAVTRLSERDQEAFLAMLDDDSAPNEALRRAAETYRRRYMQGGEAPLQAALVRLVRILQFDGSRLRTPYEALAGVLRAMRGVAVLPREQMTEVLSLPERERARLAVAAVVEEGGLTLILGDLNTATAPLSAFQPNPTVSPDFDRLALTDHGLTVRFGEYEAAVRTALCASHDIV